MVADLVGDIFQLVLVIPNLFEESKIAVSQWRFSELVDDIGKCVTLLVAKIHCGKSLKRKINSGLTIS